MQWLLLRDKSIWRRNQRLIGQNTIPKTQKGRSQKWETGVGARLTCGRRNERCDPQRMPIELGFRYWILKSSLSRYCPIAVLLKDDNVNKETETTNFPQNWAKVLFRVGNQRNTQRRRDIQSKLRTSFKTSLYLQKRKYLRWRMG